MNFTREPLILSVITPKEGSKLVIRKSSGADHEDFFVDSVEAAIFFRSLERPKSFVLPASDYEVLEVKETKMVLKNVSLEKSIKIGGNKDNNNQDKKNKKIHQKKKKQQQHVPQKESIKKENVKKESVKDEINEEVSSSVLRKLFPPPNVLIKERLTRYKVDEDLPVAVEEEQSIQTNTEVSSVIVKDEESFEKILEDSKKNVEKKSEEDNNITQDK